jgi:uncharacterized membrane protein YfcA
MHESLISLTGLLVGFTVGLTGMGGGALMTPMLVLLLGVNPLVAVSSDLVTAAVIKPVGGLVHLRHGSVHRGLVTWLCVGSVPAALAGSLLLRVAGDDAEIGSAVQIAIGIALLLSVGTIAVKSLIARRRGAQPPSPLDQAAVRRGVTIGIGILGGLVVSITSVGSGSMMMVLLLLAYPRVSSKQLVSTDLWQAVPLVATAALGHLAFGRVDFGLVALLLVGSVPGVIIGARVSVGASDRLVRRALLVVLLVSGLKMLGAPTASVAFILVAGAVGIAAADVTSRRRAAAFVTP